MNRFLVCFFILFVSFFGFAQTNLSSTSFQLVNSVYDEQNPIVSPDGKTLYLTIGNHPQNVGGIRDRGDIWFSVWVGDGWSAPVHAGPVLNDRSYNGVAGFSDDGELMYLLGHYDPTGQARTQGIAVSRKTGSGWSKPENVFIPYFQNKSTVLSGHVAMDGRVFIYSAETYGSYGVEDLYVTTRGTDGRWSEPRNLGSSINTSLQELTPSLSEDGNTLYFSSNGRSGLGSFDVYYSNRLDDSFLRWSVPVNINQPVNSAGRELFFKAFNTHGYSLYTSTTNSDGYGDIRFYKPDPKDSTVLLVVPDTLIKMREKKYIIAENEIRVYGKVYDAVNEIPVKAGLKFAGATNTYAIESQRSLGYSVNVNSTDTYTLEVIADGYISSLEKLDLHTLELRELEMDFRLQPIVIGATVNLKNVLFVQSKPALLPESYQELDLVVAFMKSNPTVEIELAGHTDSRGSFRQLMELSQQRVNRVKEYMVSKGIDKKRITGKGYGGSKPIANNDTEEGRMLNRRVEFIIKKN
ncbi:MAG: OmpA family protein [Cyclobacteriaceae bacterium]|nr:OmpA family protein [Cyclobacteriaceae bacterium]